MDRDDLVKLVGVAANNDQCVPVAFLLSNGYACAGYYHATLNRELASTCVLLNARLIELRERGVPGSQPSISDFNDFLEEIVANFCEPTGSGQIVSRSDAYGKSIPLTAIPFTQIAVVYPVAYIGELLRRADKEKSREYSFLDLNKSEIINLLRTKLW